MASLAAHYVMRELIGEGGMAKVYVGYHLGPHGFRNRVAIKMMLDEIEQFERSRREKFRRLFIEEARIMSELDHPNLVKVLSLYENAGGLYMVMEYVDGVSVFDLIRLRQDGIPIPVDIALLIFTDVLRALMYLHELKDTDGSSLKFVHRDVSPQNVLISFNGAVKLGDFGVSKGNYYFRTPTRVAGEIKGKFEYLDSKYLNPKDRRPADHFSDQHAAGLVLREMLTQRFTFGGSRTADEAFDKVRGALLPSIRRINPEVTRALEKIADRMIHGDDGAKFPSIRAALEEVHRVCKLPPGTREKLCSWMETNVKRSPKALKKLTDEETANLLEALAATQPGIPDVPEAILKGETSNRLQAWHLPPLVAVAAAGGGGGGVVAPGAPPEAPPRPVWMARAAASGAPPTAGAWPVRFGSSIVVADPPMAERAARTTLRPEEKVVIDLALVGVELPFETDGRICEPSTPAPIEDGDATERQASEPGGSIELEEATGERICEPSTPAPIETETTTVTVPGLRPARPVERAASVPAPIHMEATRPLRSAPAPVRVPAPVQQQEARPRKEGTQPGTKGATARKQHRTARRARVIGAVLALSVAVSAAAALAMHYLHG